MHIAVALLKDGQRVGTIDLDGHQRRLSRYIQNRRILARHRGVDLQSPVHRYIQRVFGETVRQSEAAELATFQSVICGLGRSVDFLVIDTPANVSHLMRLAHQIADTLLTPLNDNFLDLEGLGFGDHVSRNMTEGENYAAMVVEARRRRRRFDGCELDWRVICNRLSLRRRADPGLNRLALELGFRPLDGCAERIVYRQFFASGLTAFDSLDETLLGGSPGSLHRAAQQEMRDLYSLLELPTNDRARRLAVARAEWSASTEVPLGAGEMLAF
jgi:chromosome partitioning protein